MDTILGPVRDCPGTRSGILTAAIHPEITAIANTVLCSAGEDPELMLRNLACELDLAGGRVPGLRDPLRRLLAPVTPPR